MTICLATIHLKPAFTPLALLYLKAYLVQSRGYAADDVAIVEAKPDTTVEAMVDRILSSGPDIVGLSCYVWNVVALMEVARGLKAKRPGIRIVAGGPEVGPVADRVLREHPDVDAVVRSEGERPFADLVDGWRDGGGAEGVRGVSCASAGRILKNDDAPIVADLNELPSPHFSGYLDHTQRVVCVETQRGCVFRCNFCFYNKDFSIRNRRFDLERVKAEIAFWLQQDIRELYLMDPVFNLNAARAKDICRFLVAHNTRGIPIHAEVWAEFIDDELARLMRDARFEFLEVGLQTTDDAVLSNVERRLKPKPFVEGIASLKRHGLKFEVQLIYGLPGETAASFRESLNFAAALDPTYLAVFPLMVLPGTALWNKAGALRLDFDPVPPYFARSHASMGEAEMAYGRRIMRALEHLAPSRTIRLLSREPTLTFADIVDEWIARDDEPEDGVSDPDEAAARFQAFLSDLCERRHIPAAFYRQCAIAERRPAAATLAPAPDPNPGRERPYR